nr:MAG TPA: hypothetical protein [Caudoviricetes sp.]
MKLSEFKKAIQRLGLTHSGEKRQIYISEYSNTCASVALRVPSVAWISVGGIKDENTRARLINLVAEFANTPLSDRYEKIIAKHENGSYVKEVTLLMMGKPALRVEMTNNYAEANDSISSLEREWLDNFFGDKISYIEEY